MMDKQKEYKRRFKSFLWLAAMTLVTASIVFLISSWHAMTSIIYLLGLCLVCEFFALHYIHEVGELRKEKKALDS